MALRFPRVRCAARLNIAAPFQVNENVPAQIDHFGRDCAMRAGLTFYVEPGYARKMLGRDAATEKHEGINCIGMSVAVMRKCFGIARGNVLVKPTAPREM